MTLRVLHFVTDLDRRSGGPSVSVPQLCRELGRDPDTTVHLVARPSAEQVNIESDAPFTLHLLDGSRRSVRQRLDSLLTEQQHPDSVTLIHFHGLWDPMFHWAARTAHQQKIPVVYSIRGMLEPWALSHKRWKKRCGWFLYQYRDLLRASLLHGSSSDELESIDRAELSRIPQVSIPNGVTPPSDINEILSKTERRKTLLFLGRLHPIKGLLPLLDAWSSSAPPDWTLQLTGPDCEGHQGDLEAVVRKHGIEDSVRFTESVEGTEKWRCLASASCLVLPSFSENFGMVVAEALAAGTPVAASTGSPWQCLESKGAGWWVEPNKKALAGFLKDLGKRTAAELNEMGNRGRELVQHDFGWEAIAEEFLEKYREIGGI